MWFFDSRFESSTFYSILHSLKNSFWLTETEKNERTQFTTKLTVNREKCRFFTRSKYQLLRNRKQVKSLRFSPISSSKWTRKLNWIQTNKANKDPLICESCFCLSNNLIKASRKWSNTNLTNTEKILFIALSWSEQLF